MLSTPSLSRNEGSERGDVQGHQPSRAPNSGWSDLKVRPFLFQLLPPLTDGLVLLLTQGLEGRWDLESREAWERVLNEQRLRGHDDESPELTFQENLTLTPVSSMTLGGRLCLHFPIPATRGGFWIKTSEGPSVLLLWVSNDCVFLSPKYHRFNYAMS